MEVIGMDGMWAAAEAFRLSRDVETQVPWDDVYTIDGPVTEMPSALVHFKDFTIVEREIVASSRIHVMWARTSFVDSPDKYRMPDGFDRFIDEGVHLELKKKMIMGKVTGLHQDEWRVSLPVMALTSFTCRIGYRDLIKLAKYFDYLAAHSRVSTPLSHRFEMVCDEMKSVVDKFTGSRDKTVAAMGGMTLAKFLHEGPVASQKMISSDGFRVVTMSMPVWLRAHFVRHRPLLFVDDLFDAILTREDVMNATIETPIAMEMGATKDLWHALLSRRSCWLTQSTLAKDKDPWSVIIGQFLEEGPAILPCSIVHCSQSKDAMLRVEGKDPGCPCPRHLSINRIDPSKFSDRMEQALASRHPFWRKIYEKSFEDANLS